MARKRLGLSGPTPDYLTGNIKDIIIPELKKGGECTPFISYNFFKTYGKTFALNFGINPMQISTVDLDIIREVFIKQFSNFVEREDTNEMFSSYPLGESLLQVRKYGPKGYGWKDIRSVVSPVFTTGKMKQMHFIMQERIEVLLELLAKKTKNGEPIDIYDEFQALTLDVIGRTAFGIESDSLNDRTQQFYVESRDFFNRISLTGSLGVVLGFVSTTLCRLYRPFSKLTKVQQKLANDLKQVILYRKQHINDFKKVDLIQLLLKKDEERQTKENKPPMHIDTIVSNCFAFLLAGYETTSTALAFSAWLLAKHPEAQEKLYQEIREKLDGRTPDYDTVMKLPYLDAVFKECLRLKPPVALFTGRRCIQDTTVCGLEIKKDESILAPVHAIHWNEDYWPEPFKFDPERFTDGKTYDPLTWVPFGIGPRNCVGLRFAELEYKTAIVEVVRRFRLQLHPTSETDIKSRISGIIMRPCNGVIVQLFAR